MPPTSEKPRVYANAFICESSVTEKSTGVLTAVRIANRFTHAPYRFIPHLPDGTLDEQNAQLFYPPFNVSLIFNFHSDAPTEFAVTVRTLSPTGRAVEITPQPVVCRITDFGDTHTLNLSGEITTQEEGLYWFEVYVDGQLATKAPLRITLRTGDFASDSDQESDQESEGQKPPIVSSVDGEPEK